MDYYEILGGRQKDWLGLLGSGSVGLKYLYFEKTFSKFGLT